VSKTPRQVGTSGPKQYFINSMSASIYTLSVLTLYFPSPPTSSFPLQKNESTYSTPHGLHFIMCVSLMCYLSSVKTDSLPILTPSSGSTCPHRPVLMPRPRRWETGERVQA
jgi:hypothetical protein